jgi:DNA-binding IclR family transcriptional regulator
MPGAQQNETWFPIKKRSRKSDGGIIRWNGRHSEGEGSSLVKSLNTALRIYAAFGSGQADWGVGELAESCGITKGQASKILAVFRQFGLLKQDAASKRYSVDLQSFVIGSQYLIRDALVRQALPIMRQLTQSSGHSVRLSVRHDDQLIYLLVTVGPHLLESGWRAGSAIPWHTTSAGRVMLAYMNEAERNHILDKLTSEGLTQAERRELEKALERARSEGFAIARNQATRGLGAVSVPVLDAGLRVVGALAIAFPDDLLRPEEVLELVEPLHAAARALSLRNGAQVYSIKTPVPRPTGSAPGTLSGRRRTRPLATGRRE